jgi:peptidoglycan/LPS O-acetylase OafA/YrhL
VQNLQVEIRGDKNRLQILDVLRFAAAGSVLLYHMTYIPSFLPHQQVAIFDGVGSVSKFGYLGVELFFLISGFVILWSADGRSAAEFVISRIARLYPTYWVAVLITLTVLSIAGTAGTLTMPLTIAANLGMMAGYVGRPYVDGVYWTLQAELKFYFIVTVLLLLRQMKNIERWLFAWVIGLLMSQFVSAAHWVRPLVIYPYGSFFAAGGLFFLCWRDGLKLRRTVALAICCVLSALAVNLEGPAFMHDDHSIGTMGVAVAIVVVQFGVFFAIAGRRLYLPPFPIWLLLGSMTYPLYLVHNQIGKLIAKQADHALGPIGAVFVGAMIPVAMAIVLARSTERYACPGLKRLLLRLTGINNKGRSRAV